ncbi:MAG: hypothetical protein M0R06_06335 [Sphaerochaeta sp.]|jgi:hypothetical protein|nr:hypothetical protein [Sphaerochaeta sp.]
MDNFYQFENRDGVLKIWGLIYHSAVEVVHYLPESNRYICRVKGCKTWRGLGQMWQYSATIYLVFQVSGDKLMEIDRGEFGPKWRRGLYDLVQKHGWVRK